jgi:hypothetical protein
VYFKARTVVSFTSRPHLLILHAPACCVVGIAAFQLHLRYSACRLHSIVLLQAAPVAGLRQMSGAHLIISTFPLFSILDTYVHIILVCTILQYRLIYGSSPRLVILPNGRISRYYAICPLAGGGPSDIRPRVGRPPASVQILSVVCSRESCTLKSGVHTTRSPRVTPQNCRHHTHHLTDCTVSVERRQRSKRELSWRELCSVPTYLHAKRSSWYMCTVCSMM